MHLWWDTIPYAPLYGRRDKVYQVKHDAYLLLDRAPRSHGAPIISSRRRIILRDLLSIFSPLISISHYLSNKKTRRASSLLNLMQRADIGFLNCIIKEIAKWFHCKRLTKLLSSSSTLTKILDDLLKGNSSILALLLQSWWDGEQWLSGRWVSRILHLLPMISTMTLRVSFSFLNRANSSWNIFTWPNVYEDISYLRYELQHEILHSTFDEIVQTICNFFSWSRTIHLISLWIHIYHF